MKRLLLFAVAALTFVGCNNAFEEGNAHLTQKSLPTLTAGFEEETRTYVEDGLYLRWHEGDLLTAFYGNTLNRQYKFNGKTGDNSGSFKHIPSGDLETGNAFDRIYAIYPYQAAASITDSGVISYSLPAEQEYADNSFGKGANTMVAVTENLEDTFLSFKNACGYLKVKLYGDGTVKSIELRGNNGEKIAGNATITAVYGETPQLTMATDAVKSITLNCGDGTALSNNADKPTEFWFVVPPMEFSKGITITATDMYGSVFEQSTSNKVVVERNEIQPMAAIEAKFEEVLKPANNEIWYTATAKVEPYYDDEFGATLLSNVYDSTTKEGILTFDSNVTMIGDKAFYECRKLTSVTIPDSVTTIGREAFYYCTSLTSVTIGDSVTTIGGYAFRSCDSLTSVTIGDSVTTIDINSFAACYNLKEFKGKFAADNGRCLIIDGVLNSFANGCGATEYTIPDSVTTIGDWAFYSCDSLTSVTIGDSVTMIGDKAFYECRKLTSVTIPDSVTTIGDWAFYSCDSLTSVTIGDSVTTIGNYAFCYCSKLKYVYSKPTTPPSMGGNVFTYSSNIKSIYVPTGSVDAYKAASYWKSYADKIVGYDF